MINESPYDKKISDIRRQMAATDKAPRSNIPVPGNGTYSSKDTIQINGEYKSLKDETWHSASDVAKSVGANKIFAADCDYYREYSMSDHSWREEDRFTICFYASDINEAKDMLDTFSREHDWTSTSLNLTHTPFGHYTFTNIHEVSTDEAKSILEKSAQKINGRQDISKDLSNHILYLPTKKILDEMKQSIDWAMKVLQKMKDNDERKKREIWIQTPEGKIWKELYDKEQVLLQKLDVWNQKQAAKQAARDAEAGQRQQNVDEIIECYDGKSTKFPQYNGHFIPVIVKGGKKFNGKGYLTAIESREGSFSYYSTSEWDEAILFCPTEQYKFPSANLKYCKIDDTVSKPQLDSMKDAFYDEKVESTKAWCRKKDPSKSEGEISKWAANIIRKYLPEIDFKKYFGIEDIDADKAKSTAEWACSLPDAKTPAKAEYIIQRALSKKGIDSMKYKDIIAPIIIKKYGRTEIFK